MSTQSGTLPCLPQGLLCEHLPVGQGQLLQVICGRIRGGLWCCSQRLLKIRDGETTTQTKFAFFGRGGGVIGGREEKRPRNAVFLGKRHDNKTFESATCCCRDILLSLRRLLEKARCPPFPQQCKNDRQRDIAILKVFPGLLPEIVQEAQGLLL